MKIEYEKLVSFLIKLVIVLTYFISFDKYINVAHIIIAFIFILMLISLKTKENKISFYKSDWLYVGFAIYCIIDSILFSSVDGIKYSIYLLSAIVLSFCIRNHNDNDVKIFSIIQIMSTIFSAVTILFYFLPSLKISSYYMIYSYDKASEISRLSGIAGLAGQTGLNSFYIGLGIITLFVYIINNQGKNQKRKILAFFLLFLNCIAFMLTQKRGPLLFLVFSIIYIYILMKNKDRNNILSSLINVFKISLILIFIYFLCSITIPDTLNVFTRFLNQTDITNGRETLYNLAIDLYNQHKFIGVGINNFPNYALSILGTKIATHNVFLQVLCETGILVAIYFVITILINLIISIKNAKESKSDESYVALGIHIFFLLYCLTGNVFYDFSTLIIYFLIVYYKKKEVQNEECCIDLS